MILQSFQIPRTAPATRLPSGAPAEDTFDTAHAIGWDHARHGLTPPLEQLCINPRLQQGYRTGRAAFAAHPVAPGAAQRAWLQLRLAALAEGRTFESVALTPNYLAQLATSHCPVTREALNVIDAPLPSRLRADAGYAAGHLAVLGPRARAALPAGGYAAAVALLERCEAARNGPARIEGLSGDQWARLAVACSFVVELPHPEAAAVPMRLLPPNRVRLLNPAQALQAALTLAFLHETPNKRLAALRAAMPDATARSHFDAFVEAYGIALGDVLATRPGIAPRWAAEDAWADRFSQQRWTRLARALSPAECETIAAAHAEGRALQLPQARATEGWSLDTAGLLPRAASRLVARTAPPLSGSAKPRTVPARSGRLPAWPAPAKRIVEAAPQPSLFPGPQRG